ncbi:MAG: cyclic peptide export ABC transporter [Polyangiaceae bacterium]
MKPWLAFLRPMRAQLSVAVLASAVSGFAAMLLVALINRALASDGDGLDSTAAQFAGVSLVALSFRWLSEERFARLGQSALARLRFDSSRLIAGLPYREFEQKGSAVFHAALTEDAGAVAHTCSILPGVLLNLFLVLASFGYMAFLSLTVFALVMTLMAFGVAGYMVVEARAARTLRRARDAEDELFRRIGSLLDGGKELRLHASRRRAFLRDGLGAAIERARALRSEGLSVSVTASIVGMSAFFAVIGVVAFGLRGFWGFERSLVSGYALVFLYLIFPLESLLGALPMVERGRIAIERLDALTGFARGADSEADSAPELPPPPSFQSLVLENVTHRYRGEARDSEFVLGPVNLELRPGQITFIVGGNGSGKTTLAKLLVGLYTPEHGRVMLNGVEVVESTRAAHRGCCSAVFADFHLFDTLWGLDDEVELVEAQASLERLQLSSVVSIAEGRFSSVALSQGQRKRLAYLVSTLERRPVVLFDEWAADQDPTNKALFYREMLPALARMGKAVVVVTHDDRYFELGDSCLKLEFGQLVSVYRRAPRNVDAKGNASLRRPDSRTSEAL